MAIMYDLPHSQGPYEYIGEGFGAMMVDEWYCKETDCWIREAVPGTYLTAAEVAESKRKHFNESLRYYHSAEHKEKIRIKDGNKWWIAYYMVKRLLRL